MSPITRRRLLTSAGIGAAGIGLGATGYLVGQDSAEANGDGTGTVPFYGEHQAGIDTAAQDRLHFAAFDLLSEDPAELRELMREWSKAAAEMTAGQMIGDVNNEELAPPDDTGETVGLLPSSLTVTFGFGPAVFERPDEFLIDRPDPGRHLSFSLGLHHCLGAALARLEGRIAIEELTQRYPALELAGPPTRRSQLVLRGFESVPVRAAQIASRSAA